MKVPQWGSGRNPISSGDCRSTRHRKDIKSGTSASQNELPCWVDAGQILGWCKPEVLCSASLLETQPWCGLRWCWGDRIPPETKAPFYLHSADLNTALVPVFTRGGVRPWHSLQRGGGCPIPGHIKVRLDRALSFLFLVLFRAHPNCGEMAG